MAIIKNEIPILEYDDNPHSVLMPNHEKLNLKLPQKAVFAFLGDWIDEYARQHDCKFVGTFESALKLILFTLLTIKDMTFVYAKHLLVLLQQLKF